LFISRVNYYMLQVSNEERLLLLKNPPRSPSYDSVWKWADVIVNKDNLTSILIRLHVDPYPQVLQPSPDTVSSLSTAQ